MVSLKEATKFHGHLGPWLVVGLQAGKSALKMLDAQKYFRIMVKVGGANKKPQSCLIDGLQLSTGATYGKGNIRKINSKKIVISFKNLKTNQRIKISLKRDLLKELGDLKRHKDSKVFARKLYNIKPINIFNIESY